jgi:hypothetical protein
MACWGRCTESVKQGGFAMENKSAILSREELYDRVWTTPMRQLAEVYGLSDVGLAKICDRHDIPRPGRGYWAKKEHGKPVEHTPLPMQHPNCSISASLPPE